MKVTKILPKQNSDFLSAKKLNDENAIKILHNVVHLQKNALHGLILQRVFCVFFVFFCTIRLSKIVTIG